MNMVFSSDAGERVFNYLAGYGHLYSQPSVDGIETNELIFREGRRDIVLEIIRVRNMSDEEINEYIKGAYE